MAGLIGSIATAAAGVTPLGWVGLGFSALGTLSGISDARAQGKMERATAENNARIAEVRAENTRRQSLVEQASSQRGAAEQSRIGRLRRSAAVAAGASSGATGYETELERIDEISLFNALSTIYEGDRIAAGLRADAVGAEFDADTFRHEIEVSRRRQSSKITSGLLSFGSTLGSRLDGAARAPQTKPAPPRNDYEFGHT